MGIIILCISIILIGCFEEFKFRRQKRKVKN